MSKYAIIIAGCDDCTAFSMELTEQEFEVVNRLAEIANKASQYECMPTMEVATWENRRKYTNYYDE